MDTIFLSPTRPAPIPGACTGCTGDGFALPIAMAFQPIIRQDGTVFAFEALVRGAAGEGAATVLSHVTDTNRYQFDQLCRTTAITTAAAIGLKASGAMLSINFSPNAIYEPARCLRSSLAAARRAGLPNSAILFEIIENERSRDPRHLQSIVRAYREMGFKVAIDDFGSHFSNLDLLADLQPDLIKLDMALVRGIDTDRKRQAILRSLLGLCAELDIAVIAEGVETREEYAALRALGITLFQGYLFARPVVGRLARPVLPAEN